MASSVCPPCGPHPSSLERRQRALTRLTAAPPLAFPPQLRQGCRRALGSSGGRRALLGTGRARPESAANLCAFPGFQANNINLKSHRTYKAPIKSPHLLGLLLKSAGPLPKRRAGRETRARNCRAVHACCGPHSGPSGSRAATLSKPAGHRAGKAHQGVALETPECVLSPGCVTPPELRPRARAAKWQPSGAAKGTLSGCSR